MNWRLLTVAFGTAVVALVVVVIWQLLEHRRWRRRFAGILDLDHEIATRRRACDAELADRERAFDAAAVARRGALDAELANLGAEIARTRRSATQELADTMRRTAELQDRHASAKQVHDRLRAELSALEQATDAVALRLYEPIFHFDSPDDYKRRLIEVRDHQHAMVRDALAICCGVDGTTGDHRRGGELGHQVSKLMLRAFNAECDAVAAKVTWNNALRMIERVKHAFDAINKLGSVAQVALTESYRELKLDELRLEYELEQKRRDLQEDQRAIREQQREEDHIEQELERVRKEAEDEEGRWRRALDQAYRDLTQANGAGVQGLRAQIATIESELRDARQRQDRAILRAGNARAGHVYILSNIGSLGDAVYKIGMTRRDNPMDHVHELEQAVPFSFDVHAMIPSDDAPELAGRLHRQFHHRRVNAMDPQCGFFQVTLDEIEAFARSQGVAVQVTRLAEARRYRETLERRRQTSECASPWQVHDSDGDRLPAAL